MRTLILTGCQETAQFKIFQAGGDKDVSRVWEQMTTRQLMTFSGDGGVLLRNHQLAPAEKA